MITLVVYLVLICFVVSAGNVVELDGEKFGSIRSGLGARNMLVLFYSSPVNSKESEASVQVWKQVSSPLSGLVDVGMINCDDFLDDCLSVKVAHFPQTILYMAGDPIMYSGPMTAKAIFLFVTNNVLPPVAQLSTRLLDWWLETEVKGRKAVICFHDKLELPHSISALATMLRSSHAFAEIRSLSSDVRERFRVQSLPAVVMVNATSGTFISYKGEMKRKELVEFLRGSAVDENRGMRIDESIAPAETFGMSQLTHETFRALCDEVCSIVFIPHGNDKETLKVRPLLCLDALFCSKQMCSSCNTFCRSEGSV